MADGRDDDGQGSLLGESEHEQLGERYREPDDPEFDLGPEIPQAPDPTENDVDPELSARFWALVLVFNVALLGLGVGAMIALLGGNPSLGGQLFAGGLVVFAYGVYRYRQVRRSLGGETGDRNG